MKKLLVLLVAVLVFSCTAEDELDCNCGLIIEDRASDYSVLIRNACSGNEKRWTLYPGDWMTAYVGTDYCITNTTSW